MPLSPSSDPLPPWLGNMSTVRRDATEKVEKFSGEVGCVEGCLKRHKLQDVCLGCGLVWSKHSGHRCADGTRGSFPVSAEELYTQLERDAGNSEPEVRVCGVCLAGVLVMAVLASVVLFVISMIMSGHLKFRKGSVHGSDLED